MSHPPRTAAHLLLERLFVGNGTQISDDTGAHKYVITNHDPTTGAATLVRAHPKVRGKAARKAEKRMSRRRHSVHNRRPRRQEQTPMQANHLDLVQQEHARRPPTSGSLESCFAFQQRVLSRLATEFPLERWGYLAKGGENTTQYRGETIKVGRVCAPDGQLYKILTDIPTTNDPIWNDDGNVAVDLKQPPEVFYRPLFGSNTGPIEPPVDPPPAVPADPSDAFAHLVDLMLHVEELVKQQEDRHVARYNDLVGRLNELKVLIGQTTHAPISLVGTVKLPYLGTGPITLTQK